MQAAHDDLYERVNRNLERDRSDAELFIIRCVLAVLVQASRVSPPLREAVAVVEAELRHLTTFVIQKCNKCGIVTAPTVSAAPLLDLVAEALYRYDWPSLAATSWDGAADVHKRTCRGRALAVLDALADQGERT